MAEVRVEQVHITLDRREAEGLSTLISLVNEEDFNLDSLRTALFNHGLFPASWSHGRHMTLDWPIDTTAAGC